MVSAAEKAEIKEFWSIGRACRGVRVGIMKVTFEQKLKGVKWVSHAASASRAFQTEEPASAKALR